MKIGLALKCLLFIAAIMLFIAAITLISSDKGTRSYEEAETLLSKSDYEEKI